MDFVFDKIETTNCAHCGGLVDVAGKPAFQILPCPHCNIDVRVPGKLGTLLLEEEVGRGAAGIVYKALDSTLHRHVAVKILKPDGGEDNKKIVEATVAEARALAAINHANVVHIHTIGMRHGQPFIVMELLIGSGKLNEMLKEGWIADEKRGLEIGIDVAQGLRAAQSAGLLHRDVKPGNILFNAESVAKLLDFSVVHAATGDGEKVVIGTPYYIAPEAARGLEVDFRADLYSLGATLFHLMTGKPVFDGESSRDVMRARLKQRAPDIRSIKPGLSSATAAVLARMLEIDPKDRHASYDELIADLKAALDSLQGTAAEPAVSSELAELHDALSGAARPAAIPVATSRRAKTAAPPPVKKGMSPAVIGIAAVAAIVVVGGIIWAVAGGSGKSGDTKDKSSLATNTDPRRDREDPPVTTDPAKQGGETTPPVDPPPVDPPVKQPEPDPTKDGTGKHPDPDPDPPVVPPQPPQPPVVPPKPPVVQPQPPVVAFDVLYKAWLAQVSAQVRQQPTDWKMVQLRPSEANAGGTIIRVQDDSTVLFSGASQPQSRFQMDMQLPVKLSDITALRIEALPDDSLPGRGPGRGPNGNFVLTHVEMRVRPGANPGEAGQPYELHNASADFSQDKFPAENAIDGDLQSGWAVGPRFGEASSIMFAVKTAPAAASEAGMALRLILAHQSPHLNHTLGKFRFSFTTSKDPFLPLTLPDNIKWILTATNGRTAEQEKDLQDYFRRVKIEGLPYIPPGGVATNTPGPVTPPKPGVPAPPKLDAYAGIELAKLADKKLYDAQPNATVLIPRFSSWHVWARETPVPTGWSAPGFYATGWSLEDAAIGFGYDNVRTQLKDMKGQHSAVYARAPFTVPDPAKIGDLLIQGRFDDAIIVYINGQQVYRSPNLVGEGNSAKVSQGTTRSLLVSYELKDAKKHLKPGANVIAIECHNATKQDVDFIFDPALVATPIPEPRKPVANNKKLDWSGVDGKLYTEGGGLLIEGESKPPKLENNATKTDFDDRAYNVRVVVTLKTTTAGSVKLDAKSKPKNVNNSVTDSDTQNIAVSSRSRDLAFKVKVTGKLQGLTLHLPKGESTIESIRIINERDSKVLESWDFEK